MAGSNGSGRERALQLVIRVQLDSVSIVLSNHGLEVAEVEAGESDGSIGLHVRDAPLAVDAVFDRRSGGRHGQALRIAECQVVIGQAAAGSRIPGAARADVVNLVARIADDGAFVMDFDLVRDGGIERGVRDQQELAVVIGLDEVWSSSRRTAAMRDRTLPLAGRPRLAEVTRMLGDRLKGKADRGCGCWKVSVARVTACMVRSGWMAGFDADVVERITGRRAGMLRCGTSGPERRSRY